jgi:hypothetical protein
VNRADPSRARRLDAGAGFHQELVPGDSP